ncbi:hypothetical protein B0A54_12541 [Friedmanniomyces endolithicus]|uniref:Transcription factor domain-containing protein n=1 Tax=Friedmanniomyces endolithicus TaxID=329885 RepID=A0A4U0UKB8_9PEZI|nr:hypothetical protein B0A54_12541 [Friedmanniomyces endolithicus]
MQLASPSIPDSDPAECPGVNIAHSELPVEQQLDILLEHNTFVEGPFDPEWFDLNPDIYYANQNNSCGFISNAHIVDEVDRSDFRPDLETATGVPMPKHFSESVPLKALRDVLLRNAIAAVAAKQLGRVKGPKPFYGSQCQQPSRKEVLEDVVNVDWFYKAANYYDKAIAFSRVYLEALSGTMAQSISVAKSDNLLVAVTAWINRRRTYLDTEDLDTWRSCGLQLRDDGALYADTLDLRIDTSQCRQTIQLVYHTLIWLLLRVTNYLAQDSHRTPVQQLEMWNTLNTQLDAFNANLPESFQPCAQIRAPLPTREQLESDLGYCQFTEVFFSSSSSASSMQLYHFARLLLLLNRPREPDRKGINRLQAYREVSSEATKHAREIVGVALGRPAPAVRVEMLLPLYIAGGCLEAAEEKNVVLGIMCDIEKETGSSTEVTVRSLMDEWGWERETLESFE